MKSLSRTVSSVLAALILAGTAPSLIGETAMAQNMTDYERGKIAPYVDNPALLDRPDLWTGQSWNMSADYNEVTAYLSNYLTTMNKGLNTWPGLTNSAKTSDEGRAFAEYMNARRELGLAMQAAYPAFNDAKLAEAQRLAEAEAAAQAEAQATALAEADTAETVNLATLPDVGDDNLAACQAFRREVQGGGNAQRMQTLRVVLSGTSLGIGDASQVREWRAFATEVKNACAAAGPEVTRRKCKNAYSDEDQPASWCADIGRADDAIRAMVMAEVSNRIGTLARYGIQSVEEFRNQDGWLTKEGPQTFNGIFSPASVLKPYAREQIELLLAEIDLTLEDVSDDLAVSAGRLGELRAAVLETAGSWEMPRRAGDNYATVIAGEQLQRAYKDGVEVEVIDSYLSRTEWKIHKNALGIPDRRTLPGYSLVRLSVDPDGLCQLRSFTITEQFDGTGYQKTSGVRFGYTRFHTCP